MPRVFKILIVDDEEAIGALLTETLKQSRAATFQCEWVNRLAPAKGVLLEKNIDLVILDLNLPDSMGLDGLHEILQLFPEVAIIVFTGDYGMNEALAAIDAGAQGYIPKPLADVDILTREICYAILRHRRERRHIVEISSLKETIEALNSSMKTMETNVSTLETQSSRKTKLAWVAVATGAIALLTEYAPIIKQLFTGIKQLFTAN